MTETQVFTMRFDRKTRAELDALANKADRTQAWVIRDLVRKAAVRNGIVVSTLPDDETENAATPEKV